MISYSNFAYKQIKKILLVILITSLFFSAINIIHAQDVINFDTQYYSTPKNITLEKIVVIKITPLLTEDDKFLTALNSLFIDNLNINQSIFSYVVLKDKIYKLKDFDQSYSTSNNLQNTGYIAYTQDIPKDFLSQIQKEYNIKSFLNGNIVFTKDTFSVVENDEIKDIPNNKGINFSITDFEVNYEKNPAPGSIQKVSMKFKNNSYFPIINSDISPIFVVSTNNGKESPSIMFLNDRWYSKSRTGKLNSQITRQGEIGELNFEFMAPVENGKFSQKFSIANENGDILNNTEFEISVDVPKLNDVKICEAKDNGYGYINIRSEMKANGRIVGFINKGTKILLLEDKGSWVRVGFDGDKDGWVQSFYVKKL